MPQSVLQEALAVVDLPGIEMEVHQARRAGLVGTRFRVMRDGRPIEGPEPEEVSADGESGAGLGVSPPRLRTEVRRLTEVTRAIQRSALRSSTKERALQLFARLGEAEARVQGIPVERVQFDEDAALDAIVDLVGAAAAVGFLSPDGITCGPVNVGGAKIESDEGHLPVPPPAVAQLVLGMPIYRRGEGELLTPTGAVLLAELVDSFEPRPAAVATRVGYGLGRRELDSGPNAVRLWLSERAEEPTEAVALECEIDGLPGERFGLLMERLGEDGAMDVTFTQVQTQKNRPGVRLTVLCRPGDLRRLAETVLAESACSSCRWSPVQQIKAQGDSRRQAAGD